MNQLSWLIYLADVANSSEGWFVFFGWFFGILGVLTCIIASLCHANIGNPKDEKGKLNDPEHVAEQLVMKRRLAKTFGGIIKFSIPLAIFSVIATITIPSRDTMYAIAASELGERAMQTPLVGKMGDALEAWLDRQISPKPKPAQPAQPAV